jgi:hypothetical protein
MVLAATCSPTIRPLYAWEIQEARRVFANRLLYDHVRVHECVDWPNLINRLGTRLKGLSYTGDPTAITLGNHLYFPVQLLTAVVTPADPQFYKLGWLIHELTHAWQYQCLGWRYIWIALLAQLRLKGQAYNFGGEEGLRANYIRGGKLSTFNPEQQGDIARSYYQRLCQGQDTSAWLPYITEIQQGV